MASAPCESFLPVADVCKAPRQRCEASRSQRQWGPLSPQSLQSGGRGRWRESRKAGGQQVVGPPAEHPRRKGEGGRQAVGGVGSLLS